MTNAFTTLRQQSGQLKINDAGSSNSISLFIDSIKLIEKSGHQTYTIPVKQANPNDVTFRNLVIDSYNGNVSTFLAIYTPDTAYLKSFIKGIKVPYTGKGKLIPFNATGFNSLQLQNNGLKANYLACYTIDVLLYTIHVPCSSGQHYYGDSRCECNPEFYDCVPAYDVEVWSSEDICYDINLLPTGGGGGGGGGTSPSTPPDYDPCPPVNVATAGLKVQKLADETPCNTPDIIPDDPNDPKFDPIVPALLDTTGLYKYPTLKNIVTNMPGFLQQNPNVLNALSYYTGFSKEKILRLMKPGSGPRIEIVPNLKSANGVDIFGHYDDGPKVLQLNLSLVLGLDAGHLPKVIQATALLAAIVTLHEFVHYGRDANHLTNLYVDPVTGEASEAGWIFESNIAPDLNGGINTSNAIKWLNVYPYKF